MERDRSNIIQAACFFQLDEAPERMTKSSVRHVCAHIHILPTDTYTPTEVRTVLVVTRSPGRKARQEIYVICRADVVVPASSGLIRAPTWSYVLL